MFSSFAALGDLESRSLSRCCDTSTESSSAAKYDELFKGLSVDEAVQKGTVQPGRYLVLDFDFSRTQRSHSMSESAEGLRMEMNRGLEVFREEYPGPNLGKLVYAVQFALRNIHKRGEKDNPLWDVLGIYVLADEYDAYANGCMDPHDPRQWSDAEPALVLKSFWSAVKAGTALTHGIRKVYTTGITPLLLADLFSGANNQQNISFDPRFSTLCGLTRSDVLGALRIVCSNEEELQKHFRELEHYANGYHFCQTQSVDKVFNTQTALSYLDSSTETNSESTTPNYEVPDTSYAFVPKRLPL
ncbi:uncharacterized protein Z518_03769 [Rhinocladiella mackenziei CBS 650.93]|uniref:AAA-ATPase-like domain-containing protein n=1 Tax=Rhinocladiella mackenziei CBS 650.93 TaxID=1442369 RepID=A0A0D2FUM5_9EURO|nr:uncharacterized protein Z518_03769 [Rhinocladiella mackenziei CBS 650.93]KIX05797.1 hypothetical protein Z518_03769 [Rhinocladiella mackenziei CBS 650.93]